MTEEIDDGIRSTSGVLLSLRYFDNGKGRLSFDDVVNESSSSIENVWKHDDRIIFKDYDLESLENLHISKNELAEIGQILLIRLIARNQTRIDRQKLITKIRSAFEDVEFPGHMGLIAAEAIDDWESEATIRDLTSKHDFHGAWWDIPESHLTRGSLGLNYLDATGMAFYLPAFMTFALKKRTCSYFEQLIFELNPVYEEDEKDLYIHFCKKFSKIKGERKQVCITFLKYMKEELLLCGHQYISQIEDINKALQHEFWKIKQDSR